MKATDGARETLGHGVRGASEETTALSEWERTPGSLAALSWKQFPLGNLSY